MARSWDGDGMIGGDIDGGRGTGRSLVGGRQTENRKTGNRVQKTFCFRGQSTKGDAVRVAPRASSQARNYGRGLAVRCSAGFAGCGAGAVEVLVPLDDPDDDVLDDDPLEDDPAFGLYSRPLDEPLDEPCVYPLPFTICPPARGAACVPVTMMIGAPP